MSNKNPAATRPMRVLVIDSDPETSQAVQLSLPSDDDRVVWIPDPDLAFAEAGRSVFDAIVLDVNSRDEGRLALIKAFRAASPWAKVIAIGADASIELAVEAMKQGAGDFLAKPLATGPLCLTLQKASDAQSALQRLALAREAIIASGSIVDFASENVAMREAVEFARRGAEGATAMLIAGETGVGKRALGRAIHSWSPRANLPLGVASCRAPSRTYLEAEWFGVMRTGDKAAPAERLGRISHCQGGSLLIEDIDLLPIPTQDRLLRLIQQGEYELSGDFATRNTDVRVLATTSADLAARVKEGLFSSELFNAFRDTTISLSPLRHRPGDVVTLAERYLAFFSRQARRSPMGFSQSAIDSLRRHSWPGNIRELRSLVERAVLVARTATIETSDFPQGALNRVNAAALGDPVPLQRIEELHIRGVLAAATSMEAAAATLGIDSVTLWRRRKRYGI